MLAPVGGIGAGKDVVVGMSNSKKLQYELQQFTHE